MESGIRLARKSDVPALCEIWQDCFLDPEDYILYFYRENFDRISVPVFTENDRPVSMLHLMDADFVNGEKRQAAKLIYAAGTTPATYDRWRPLPCQRKPITACAAPSFQPIPSPVGLTAIWSGALRKTNSAAGKRFPSCWTVQRIFSWARREKTRF